MQRIYEEGGRSFWIHNTGPLGCLSYALLRTSPTEQQLDSAGCSVLYNGLARQFNRMLDETVIQLRKDLPLAAITLVDVYSAKYKLISQGTRNGKTLRHLVTMAMVMANSCNSFSLWYVKHEAP